MRVLEGLPARYQHSQVLRAANSTKGTNLAEMRSATAWMGARAICARSTRRTIWDNVPSPPTLDTCQPSALGTHPISHRANARARVTKNSKVWMHDTVLADSSC